MKNLKTLKVFLLAITATQILLLSSDSFGADRDFCRDTENWDEKMTVADYMDSCDGAIITNDGCKLNYEKACINGVEVDLMESNTAGKIMRRNGFDPRPGNALTSSDFSDPTKMYNPVSTPGGTPIRLCAKIEGLTDQNIRSLQIHRLPTEKDYVIESTPAFIKPGLDIGANSLHWRVHVSRGQISIEVEVQNASRFDGPREVGSQKRTDLAKATGTDIADVLSNLFGHNLVRCKKETTFSDHPEFTNYYRTASEFPEKSRQFYLKDYQKVLTAIAPSGVNGPALANRFNSAYNVNLPIDDVSDDEPPKVVPRTGKSRSRN